MLDAARKIIVFAAEVALDNVSSPANRVPSDPHVSGNNWILLTTISGSRLVTINSR